MPRVPGSAAIAVAIAALATAGAAAQAGYVPQRVFDTARGAFSDFESMVADLARADVAFVGEQHDDPNTHRLELAVLEALARRRGDVILSLEMFERDVQGRLDAFLRAETPEEEFLAGARPWPRYRSDYKPLVDFAISKNWPVVAANVPRPIASEIAKGGLEVLQGKSDEDKTLFAGELVCPTDDEYFRRFGEAMGSHPAPGQSAEAARQTAERYYFSQCVKDETMAESIARAYRRGVESGKAPLVVHFNGAFHSDFRLGTAARTVRRLPDQRVMVISVLPVKDLDTIAPDADRQRLGDYLVYTIGK